MMAITIRGQQQPSQKPDEKSGEITIEHLLKVVEGLGQVVQQNNQDVNNKIAAMADQVTNLTSGIANSTTQKEEPAKGKTYTADELEELDRSQYMGVIVSELSNQFQGLIDKAISPLKEQFDQVNNTVVTTGIRGEMKELMEKHKDFKEWGAELKALSQELPNASLQRLYTIVRNENPDKAKELDEKYKEATDEPHRKQSIAFGFGGLLPSDGSRDDRPTDMSMEDAGDAAWDEMMQSLDFQELAETGS